ncbi:MAG: hypothetical protein ACLR6H_01135 [Roseburia sp.]|jgi:hypothetical protein|nr:MAG TPA: hypothetical protein [Caudoviricetes sp.]
MAKAVLVMDMPEQVCQKCTLCYETEDDEYLCCAVGKLVPDGEKPDWCPLWELPEKMPDLEHGYENVEKSIIRTGWNACLDAIVNE